MHHPFSGQMSIEWTFVHIIDKMERQVKRLFQDLCLAEPQTT